MGTWQPIETAPMDGTHVDLWMIDEAGRGERVADAYWVNDCTDFDYSLRTPSVKRSGWFTNNAAYNDPGFIDEPRELNTARGYKNWREATHWMPLPAPPAPEITRPPSAASEPENRS